MKSNKKNKKEMMEAEGRFPSKNDNNRRRGLLSDGM